jgi:hypothetical protein
VPALDKSQKTTVRRHCTASALIEEHRSVANGPVGPRTKLAQANTGRCLRDVEALLQVPREIDRRRAVQMIIAGTSINFTGTSINAADTFIYFAGTSMVLANM